MLKFDDIKVERCRSRKIFKVRETNLDEPLIYSFGSDEVEARHSSDLRKIPIEGRKEGRRQSSLAIDPTGA